MQGQVRWLASDTTAPPGPTSVAPKHLWTLAPGLAPATGNFVVLQSDPGMWIAAGGVQVNAEPAAVMAVNASRGKLSVDVTGYEQWGVDFEAMHSLDKLQAGYYGNLGRFPFHNLAKGGLNAFAGGRGCEASNGWMMIDHVAYSGASLDAIELRFAQQCADGSPPLFGSVRWHAADGGVQVPGRAETLADTWQTTGEVARIAGNYVYIETTAEALAGETLATLYPADSADLTVLANNASLDILADGDLSWRGWLHAPGWIGRLAPGHYADAVIRTDNSAATGGLTCIPSGAWFAIDQVRYDGATLVDISLRFGHRCDGTSTAILGSARWNADRPSP